MYLSFLICEIVILIYFIKLLYELNYYIYAKILEQHLCKLYIAYHFV